MVAVLGHHMHTDSEVVLEKLATKRNPIEFQMRVGSNQFAHFVFSRFALPLQLCIDNSRKMNMRARVCVHMRAGGGNLVLSLADFLEHDLAALRTQRE